MTTPARGIVLFDGACGLCDRFVQFLLVRDRTAVLSFASLQSPLGRGVVTQLGLDPALRSIVWIESGRAYREAEAVARILRTLPLPYKLGALLAWVPRPLANATYRLVARHRHQLWGAPQQCAVPTAGTRDRILHDALPLPVLHGIHWAHDHPSEV